jgi:hypothetical protein
MPDKSAPAPAYVATLTPFDLDSTPMRQVRLSRRQHRAINGLQVPIALTSPSPLTPVVQAQLAIQDAVARILRDRGVSAVLWQGEDAGGPVRLARRRLPAHRSRHAHPGPGAGGRVSREPRCVAHPCMYRDRYFQIERLLDEVLGAADADGSGEGIVADVRLALAEAEKRGAIKALREFADLHDRGLTEDARSLATVYEKSTAVTR